MSISGTMMMVMMMIMVVMLTAMMTIIVDLTRCLNNFHQVILWTKEGPKRLRFEAPDKTVTVKQVVFLDA